MKFKTSLLKEPKHSDLVGCVAWNNTEEVYSFGFVESIIFRAFDTEVAILMIIHVMLVSWTILILIRWLPSLCILEMTTQF
jgi:hypothetical protein